MTGQFSCARHVPRENELPRTYLGAQIVVRGVLDAHHILQHDDPARLPKPLSVLPCLGILVRVDDLSHLRPAQRGALSLVLTLPAFIFITLATLARLDLLDGQRVDDTRSIRAEALPFLVGTSGISRVESDRVDPLSILMVSTDLNGRRPVVPLMDDMEDLKLPTFGGGVGCGEGCVSSDHSDKTGS